MAKCLLITNNPKAAERYADIWDVEFIDETTLYVLAAVRDYIHLGHGLLTHPLASSLPPKDCPYKSVLVTGQGGELDYGSLRVIEGAMEVYSKVNLDVNNFDIPQTIAEDFMVIDCEMLARARVYEK